MPAVQGTPRVLFKNITADTAIWTGVGTYWGFYVNSTGGGSFVVYDSATNSGTKIQNTVTPTIGSYFFNAGVEFNTGLYIDITGTIDVTFFYRSRQ